MAILGLGKHRVEENVSDRVDVAIVGGGAAGIAAARRLTDLRRTVLLIEALPQLGGRARTTIAHGMLVQSLVGRLAMQMPFEVTGFRNMVNYGSARLRFPTPVPAGSSIHARCRIKQVKPAGPGTLVTLEIHIHVVGNDRPSVTNAVLILYM